MVELETMDIYFKVGKRLIEKEYYIATPEEKKKLIEKELKNYILEKIREISNEKYLEYSNKEEKSVPQLLQILANFIKEEEQFDKLRHFIHFIVIITSDMQNYLIIWSSEYTDELKKMPRIEINEQGFITELITHIDDDKNLLQLFNFVYTYFKEYLLTGKEIDTPKLLERKYLTTNN